MLNDYDLHVGQYALMVVFCIKQLLFNGWPVVENDFQFRWKFPFATDLWQCIGAISAKKCGLRCGEVIMGYEGAICPFDLVGQSAIRGDCVVNE